ncbi:MAG: ATP-dependent DNA helicase PcrA [Candidatus Harrisonbacteria bacterium CG10_big_fil_rev_8_21_14_0_10_38_8]|uniref:DNA 3'-5' helicase n=1 Tax=Candidatus Harrisonbacteria bacterium CG10_big_fil_rev_8_21_14_0_10_38_8 TaxID=1974582 RepID=A0A2M6WKB6_9BACT|nr:MAG: ATP-dependent DNA helicase PcrA [Candidatus Harrisonbacteria bacterium CG10_big_fil_rev_8_21_14_0_10_38_8]
MFSELNDQQKKAVMHPGGPLLMAAGAGSGKTKALTSRLKFLVHSGVPAHEIIAITFTNKAAKEMYTRVFGEKKPYRSWLPSFPYKGHPFIGTFHSLGAKILRNEIDSFKNRTTSFSIFDDTDSQRVVKRIHKSLSLSEKYKVKYLGGRISKIKSELQNPLFLLDSQKEEDIVLYDIFIQYEKIMEENNAFDFDDLIQKPANLLFSNKEIREKYQDMFQHVLVDEYQDINTSQYRLLKTLADKHQNITVVGDDAQAIYSFRGADFRNFLNFTKDWPKATIIKLEQNYRSSKNIINGSSGLIKKNKVQTKKTLWTDNEQGEKISILGLGDDEAEATWVANEIRCIYDTYSDTSIGIIYRVNAQSRAIEQALISQNLPYIIFGGLKFYDRKEVKDILAALKIVINPSDSMSKERLEKSLGKRRTETLLKALFEHQNQDASELISLFLEVTDYLSLLENKFNNAQERLENIVELSSFASQSDNLDSFLESVSLLQATDSPTEGISNKKFSPVNLMSIHMAKGLEFDYVFVVGCNEGNIPHERSLYHESEIEEERRLMYVAMTRGRKKLYLTYGSYPSRFLYEIPTEHVEFINSLGGLPDEDEMYIEY